MFNGQLDPLCSSVPSLENLIHSNRDYVKGTVLEKGEELVMEYFEEMHTNGCIEEDRYHLKRCLYH